MILKNVNIIKYNDIYYFHKNRDNRTEKKWIELHSKRIADAETEDILNKLFKEKT